MMDTDIDDMMMDVMMDMRGMDIDFTMPRKDFHKLIMDGKWIPKDKCIVGGIYICRGRNFNIGTWNGSSFDYMRTKFYDTYPAKEYHWDDGPPYGTVKPYLLVEDYGPRDI